MGSFAYGMQNAINDPFSKYILDESNFIQCNNIENKLEWLANFEEQLEDKTLCLTKRTENGIDFDWFRFCDDEQKSIILKMRYSKIFTWDPYFIINQFKTLRKKYPSINRVTLFLNESNLDFAKAFPNITCAILYPQKHHESWNEIIEELKQVKNIELEPID